MLVTPDKDWPQDQLSFTVKNSASSDSLFVLAACNVTDARVTGRADGVGFRYAVLDIP